MEEVALALSIVSLVGAVMALIIACLGKEI